GLQPGSRPLLGGHRAGRLRLAAPPHPLAAAGRGRRPRLRLHPPPDVPAHQPLQRGHVVGLPGGAAGLRDDGAAPPGGAARALVRKAFGTQGEGLIYVGWPLLVLAGLGLVAAVVRRRAVLAYAVLAVPLVMLTYGARTQVAGVRVYRYLFDHLPLLSLQRVPE